MIFFSERKLAQKLYADEVTEKQQVCYLLIVSLYMAAWTTTVVSHFNYSAKSNVFDHLADIVSLVGVAIAVLYSNFVNSKGDNRDFIARYVCLSIPIGIKAIILIFVLTLIAVCKEIFRYGKVLDDDGGSLSDFLSCFIVELFFIWRYKVAFKIASGQAKNSLPGVIEHIGQIVIAILFTIFLFVISFLAAARLDGKDTGNLVFDALCPVVKWESGESTHNFIERDAKTGVVTHEHWYKDCKLDRANGPAIIKRDAATGTVTAEIWYKDGKWDRADGPAIIQRDAKTGIVTTEIWGKDGKPNRADGPAYIERDTATGIVTTENWYKEGEWDRADGPAEIKRDAKTGIVTYESWDKDGRRHRIGSPAVIMRDAATGKVIGEMWAKDGRWDRADGPAIISRDAATGIITHEMWWKDGKCYRADGPAVINRDAKTGKVTSEYWYKDGELFDPSPAMREAWQKKSGEQTVLTPPDQVGH